MRRYTLQDINHLPRMGWAQDASPVESWPDMAAQLGLGEFWVKRDDAIPAFGGGNKVRKLDYLLYDKIYQEADHWHSSGAIGSSQLVVASRVAKALGKNFTAHVCNQPKRPGVLENLAKTSAYATVVEHYRSRVTMALLRPHLMVLRKWRGQAIIPPGATTPEGCMGFVRAGLELAEQVQKGELPCPDRIYLALGSGGSAIGVSIGLAMAGLSTPVHGIAIVEPILVSPPRIASVRRGLLQLLKRQGIDVSNIRSTLVIDTSEVGRGYAQSTSSARAACQRLRSIVPLEETYTGKAMAALLKDAVGLPGKRLLYWHTAARATDPSLVTD